MTVVILEAPLSPGHQDNSKRADELEDAMEPFERLAEDYKKEAKFRTESSHSIRYEFDGPDGFEQLFGPQNYHVLESNLFAVDGSLEISSQSSSSETNNAHSSDTNLYSADESISNIHCPQCSFEIPQPNKSNYCPNCGTHLSE